MHYARGFVQTLGLVPPPEPQDWYPGVMATALSFASSMLAELRQRDARAQALTFRARGNSAVIGIEDEGEFVPLLKLDAGSAAFNVMSLFVHQHGRWQPTLKRGIPKDLAEILATSLSYLWTMHADLADF